MSDIPLFAQKRLNHFKYFLEQLQAKDSHSVHNDVIKDVKDELCKLENVNKILNFDDVRKLLKKTHHINYYEHTFYIMYTINGKTPPCLSAKSEDIITTTL